MTDTDTRTAAARTAAATRMAGLAHRPVSRRCALAGFGGLGAAAVLTACGGSGSDTGAAASSTAQGSTPASAGSSSAAASTGSSSAAGGSGATVVAALADVPVGGTATAEVDGQTVLLSQPTAGTVEGFSAVCPHKGATVKPDGAMFMCPLHGSEFALDGSVTQGPATSGLEPFAVTVSGSDVVTA